MAMKWCRFQAGGKVAYGRIEGDNVVAIDGEPWGAHTDTASKHALSSVKLLVPVIPPTFFCVGLNYREHIIASAKRRGIEPKFPQRPGEKMLRHRMNRNNDLRAIFLKQLLHIP